LVSLGQRAASSEQDSAIHLAPYSSAVAQESSRIHGRQSSVECARAGSVLHLHPESTGCCGRAYRIDRGAVKSIAIKHTQSSYYTIGWFAEGAECVRGVHSGLQSAHLTASNTIREKIEWHRSYLSSNADQLATLASAFACSITHSPKPEQISSLTGSFPPLTAPSCSGSCRAKSCRN
jgi:hypothetical protein